MCRQEAEEGGNVRFAKMLINWMIWFMGIELIVRLGWTYNDPIPAGMVWIGLVGLKCALEAMTGWTK